MSIVFKQCFVVRLGFKILQINKQSLDVPLCEMFLQILFSFFSCLKKIVFKRKECYEKSSGFDHLI
jgi:hypothetical protein